jgi:hypothetical protein
MIDDSGTAAAGFLNINYYYESANALILFFI